jgi:hypothetical protein
MKISQCLLATVFGILTCPAIATPWGLPGEAVIGSENGKLSICVPKKTPKRLSVNSISVSESFLRNGERLTMWDVEMEQDSPVMFLEPGGCISYGVMPSGYKQLVEASPLKVGDTYYARVNINVANATRQSILFYDAVFCVGELQDGTLIYRQYQYERDGRTVKPSC